MRGLIVTEELVKFQMKSESLLSFQYYKILYNSERGNKIISLFISWII